MSDLVNPCEFADIVDLDLATNRCLDALESLSASDRRASLRPLFRNAIQTLKRNQTRVREQEVFKEFPGITKTSMESNLHERRLLLTTEMFILPDGNRIGWMHATAAQHRERADMQRRIASGHIKDAIRHEVAADLITKYDATCLAEVPDAESSRLFERAA